VQANNRVEAVVGKHECLRVADPQVRIAPERVGLAARDLEHRGAQLDRRRAVLS
jgi:hypothetical protein